MKLTDQQRPLPSPSVPASGEGGFSLLELIVSSVILMIVVGVAVNYIAVATQRSKVEQTKVDLTQEGRAFVDEFERDIHQAGYPGCAVFNTGGNCSAHLNDGTMAAGLVLVSNTQIILEGDADGDGVVDSIQYRLVDSAGNFPPTESCPCTVQRSQVAKVAGTAPTAQATNFSQELQNVVNSGVPPAGSVYGGGLPIAGNVLFAGGSSNDAYYAAVSTFKDSPLISVFDQNGSVIPLPVDDTTLAGQTALANIKSVRLTINLLGSGTSGYDIKNGLRPVVTLVGNGRRNN
jgi:type II secretory pathway pseudopilin PulG